MSTESARVLQFPHPPVSAFHPNPSTDLHPVSSKKLQLLRRVSLIAIDTMILGGSTFFVYWSTNFPASLTQVASLMVVVGIWMSMLQLNRLYDSKLYRPPHQLAYDIIKAAGMSMLASSAAFFLAPALSVPGEVHWNALLLATLLLLVWRLTDLRLFPSKQFKRRAIFVGSYETGLQVATEIQHCPDTNYKLVGIFENPAETVSKVDSRQRIGEENELQNIVSQYRIDSLIVPTSDVVSDGTLKSVADCAELGCELLSTSQLYERVLGKIPIQHISHGWFVSELGTADRVAYRFGKRTMDVMLSALGLLVTGLLFPFIALLIKLDSPGPIFYSQIRAGKNGRPFRIYKFRSMVQNAESHGAVWAKVNDKRVTQLGEFLRKTRLDELPQLYNVLLGEMSLVGPRPERPEFGDQLAKEIPFFNRRLMVLPGLTGWAQVNYPYGASTEDAYQKLQYDLYYIKNQTMFLDLEVLLRTISVVINKTGAR